MRIDLADVGDMLGLTNGRGFRRTAMQVQRIDDVIGIEALAIVEGDTLADVQYPFLGAWFDLPAFDQARLHLMRFIELDEAAENLCTDGDRADIGIGTGIEAVRGAATTDTNAQGATVLRRISLGR